MVLANDAFVAAQLARLNQLAVFGQSLRLGQASVQRGVNRADTVGAERSGRRRLDFEFFLGLHVSQRQTLLDRFATVAIPLLVQRAVDVGRPRVLAFDLVGVVRIHRAQARAQRVD
ncbi:MAG: hypothetical protein ACT4PZ_07130 [Panacagrimonas sp.]